MKIKYFIIFLGLVLTLSLGTMHAQRPGDKKITLTSEIADETGNPVAGATVYGNDGAVHTISDIMGKFTITVFEKSEILIEADGFESYLINAQSANTGIKLNHSVLMFGINDRVNVSYGKIPKGNVFGAVSIFDAQKSLKYDHNQSIYEAINGKIPGMTGNQNIRGLGTPVFVIDGLPRDPSYLDISEIAEISVLKDVNSAILYGAQALNGVVMINTKRGEPFKKQINVWGQYGLALPRALPKYLSSADYMEQYNIALANDGLPQQYDAATIQNYRTGNQFQFPNVDYYSSDYLANLKPYSRVLVDMSGGNKIAAYYTNLSWYNDGNLLDFGAGKESAVNRFNVRGNVDFKISDKMKTSIDAVGYINNDKQPMVRSQSGDILPNGYWNQAALLRPDLFSTLLPIDLIQSDLPELISRKNDVDGKYLAGGNTSYRRNPITDVYLGGMLTMVYRNISFTNRIDYDLGSIVPGLGFHTNISFDYMNHFYQHIQNTYSVYEPTWTQGSITRLTKYGDDNRSGNQNVGSAWAQRRFGAYAMFDYDRTFDGDHHVGGNLLGYGSTTRYSYDIQALKYTNLGLRLNYSYANKYMIDFSGALVSSSKLYPGHRVGFSPSFGLGWVISSEDFMSAQSKIDFLKLKLSGGIMNTDSNIGYFLYEEPWGGVTGSLSWYEGSRSRGGNGPQRGENKNLFYEKRKDLNVGLEGLFFDRRLAFDAFFFNNIHDDIVTRNYTEYPSWLTNYVPYQNYNKNLYRGLELGISWKQNLGDFAFMLGGNILYVASERLKVDEVYANDYQYRKGHPVDALFGLVSDGFFSNQSDINSHQYQSFGAVKPGDIKYIDQNNDGIIDQNDERYIGRSQHPLSYGIQLSLSYKRLTLFARGTGRSGAVGVLNSDYYWAQGSVKYSEYMLNNWTETTANSATYPRLSTVINNNNFRSSSFWLYNNDYFNLDRIQLTYDVPVKQNKMTLRNLSVFMNASSVLTVSKSKDIRLLNVGSEPQYRTYSIGLKTLF